ncbi:MAG: FAD-binding oxidoreductase [Acidimicrobiia bacterium]|nr:FAD-binding oxidoreductase [Acidimicrobiia bacterium]MBT8216289.1 FAD-binding oxidoreductase [Acidimicrobiia bacterium]NNF10360.1 FAD-binding oxidoreductase [Acidimicrobiia bacterium]NNL71526.1 FAD-binding oxidoreductase [Acidimicrobiia bacterium]
MRATVIGAGVIGLTTGIRLREAGVDAHIVAAEPPADTVASSMAGAIWYPYGDSAGTREAAWGRRSLEIFTALAQGGTPGLVVRDMLELRYEPSPDPWWADPALGYRRCEPVDLAGGYADGYIQQTVAIDVVPTLGVLEGRFRELGGTIELRRLSRFADATAPGELVINCAGVGAGELAADQLVHPIRGQVVRVRGEPVDRITMVDGGPLGYAYVMPHSDECVVGGTRQPGVWDRTPDDAVTEQLLETAATLEPGLRNAEVIGVKVGLRPGRGEVRVEREGDVIHNYGHAGNGWSLSWGCAETVVELATAPR